MNYVWIVCVIDDQSSIHVIELFSSSEKKDEYLSEINKIYDHKIKDGWSISETQRCIDREQCDLSGVKEHYDKIYDQEWCNKFNTILKSSPKGEPTSSFLLQ
jgi:hypothetical protein